MKSFQVAALAVAALVSSTVFSADGIRTERVQFKAGQSQATITAKIKGDQIVDYVLGAKAGQSLSVTLKSSSTSNYFNVTAPGADSALFVGSTSGSSFKGVLPKTGDTVVRVYLMRNAARRGESADYTITFAITGPAPASATAASNAGPAKWDASGMIKCSLGSDKFDKQCGFRVVRDLPKQTADIWVGNVANGESDYRFLHYANKAFTSNDSSKLAWQRKDDNWWVSVNGKEFYFIPDALIHGG